MQTKLPETITKSVFILARKHSWETEYTITFGEVDYSEHIDEYILLGTENITLHVTQTELAQAEISILRKRREKILADTELKKKAIYERIQSLLCIEQK